MRIETLPQVELGNLHRVRVGDFLNSALGDGTYKRFRFAVAFIRASGWDRLAASLESLINRGGRVSGAIGIDQEITTTEALEALNKISNDSTIFYTVSGFIYHPKLYLFSGENRAVAVIGSANLTRDGLFRNIELAVAVHLDFESSSDLDIYKGYDTFVSELLDTAHPNVQPITSSTIQRLTRAGLIKSEAQVPEPGTQIKPRAINRGRGSRANIERLFPPLSVPVAPPPRKVTYKPSKPQPKVVMPPTYTKGATTFLMQLSAFDSSHRTSVPGTPEVLIPHAAINFFPALSLSGRKYPDAVFDVVLNTPTGRERHRYRLWYYEERAVGTRIDEYRLRMDHDTINLSTPGGGDILAISKLPAGHDPAYEVTVLPQTDPTFRAFLALCRFEVNGKKWGKA